MRRFGWLVLAGAAMACGSGSGGSGAPSDLMAGFNPGPAPAAGTGYQIILPVVTNIEPDGSYEYCSWSNVITDREILVKSAQGWQTETGHHVIVFYTMNPQPAGQTRICNDADMANFRFAITGAAGEGGVTQLPANLVTKIPKGAQLVVNHHYLNASTKTVPQAQSAININLAPTATGTVDASSLAFLDTAMSIAPGKGSVDVTCKVNHTYSSWYFIPHMHNWGTHVTVDHVSGSTTNRLFDLDWDPSYAFHPPTKQEDPSKPYMLNAGDTVHVHCDYNNTTGKPLTFGAEMCVAYAQTVDATGLGNMACDGGQWGPF